jgi:hypothetical protein
MPGDRHVVWIDDREPPSEVGLKILYCLMLQMRVDG